SSRSARSGSLRNANMANKVTKETTMSRQSSTRDLLDKRSQTCIMAARCPAVLPSVLYKPGVLAGHLQFAHRGDRPDSTESCCSPWWDQDAQQFQAARWLASPLPARAKASQADSAPRRSPASRALHQEATLELHLCAVAIKGHKPSGILP